MVRLFSMAFGWGVVGVTMGLLAALLAAGRLDVLRHREDLWALLAILGGGCGVAALGFGLVVNIARGLANRLFCRHWDTWRRTAPPRAFDQLIASLVCILPPLAVASFLPSWNAKAFAAAACIGAAASVVSLCLLPRRSVPAGVRKATAVAGAVSCLMLVTVAGFVAGPRPEAPGPPLIPRAGADGRRVILIGLDGADWRRIDRLLAEGRLPALAELVRRGARAPLRTILPTLSPIVWTTVATGVPEARHGVHSFTELLVPGLRCGVQFRHHSSAFGGLLPLLRHLARQDSLPEVPITSCQRKVKAVWDILSEQGLTSGVVNWFATWPSEPIKGYVVSDNNPWRAAFLVRRFGRSNTPLQGVTHPPELLDDLAEIQPARLGSTGEEILASHFFDLVGALGKHQLRRARNLLEMFGIIHASDGFAAAAGLELLHRADLDFLALYLSGIDNVSHRFGQRPGVVDRYYEYVDGLLRSYVELLDERTTLIVVSDHGWNYDYPRHVGHESGPDGILIVAGRGARAGVQAVRSPAIVDVAPTVLGLLGLPASEEMSGEVMSGLLTVEAGASLPARRIESWGPRRVPRLPPRDASLGADLGKEILDKLRALGYLD